MATVHNIKVTGLSQTDSDRFAVLGFGSVHPDFTYQDMKTARKLIRLCDQWAVQRVIQANGGFYRVDPMRSGLTKAKYDAIVKQMNENAKRAAEEEEIIVKRLDKIIQADTKAKKGTESGTFGIDFGTMYAVVEFNHDRLPWQQA